MKYQRKNYNIKALMGFKLMTSITKYFPAYEKKPIKFWFAWDVRE